MKLTEILESVDKEILNEETLKRIEEAFETAVQTKVEDQVQLQVESALIEMDEDHSHKLESLVTAIDVDHAQKLEQVIESVEEDHLDKLKNVVGKYETELDEGAQKHLDHLTEEIDKYLDAYVEELVPTELVEQAARNTYASKILGEAKSVLSVDEKFANKQFQSAVQDGANQIGSLNEENEQLRKQLSVVKAKSFLESRTENLPSAKAQYIRKRLNGKPLNFIKENFEFVADMYEDKTIDESSALNVAPRIPTVDRQVTEDEIVTESTTGSTNQNHGENEYLDIYMEGMTSPR